MAFARESRLAEKRALAASLGKIGGPPSLALLRSVDTKDAELRRIADRAMLILEREEVRSDGGGIAPDRALNWPVPIVLHCREGLEGILEAEMAERLPESQPRAAPPGRVRASLPGRLDQLFRIRTWFKVAFVLPQQTIGEGEDEGHALVRAMSDKQAAIVMHRFSAGRARYRIAWADGSHKRALVWRCAKEIAQARPELVNDPTDTLWEACVYTNGRIVDVELSPRALEDERFRYRMRDVPAASHPTIAAALVRLAGVRPTDIVWDPFVGSGTELVERALAGPYERLFGRDVSQNALVAARENLDAAGVRDAELRIVNATSSAPPAISLVITNPPMGRRVGHGTDLRHTLSEFLALVCTALMRGGRLVWISPFPDLTRERIEHFGLTIDFDQPVDMGGFTARIQRARK